MTDTPDEAGAALHAVLDSFVAVCGAPDDAEVAHLADNNLARLDALLAVAADD